jgi:hypothetical protein
VGNVRGRCLAAAAAAVTAVVATVATSAGGALAAAPAAGAPGGPRGSPPRLAQGGHAGFWECPAATTELLVVVNTLTLHPGHSLDISFAVHNGATASSSYTAPYAQTTASPISNKLEAGPCGSVGYEIVGPHRRNVWPGARSSIVLPLASQSWRRVPSSRARAHGTRPGPTAQSGYRSAPTPSSSTAASGSRSRSSLTEPGRATGKPRTAGTTGPPDHRTTGRDRRSVSFDVYT